MGKMREQGRQGAREKNFPLCLFINAQFSINNKQKRLLN
jgi:hypothetical protein